MLRAREYGVDGSIAWPLRQRWSMRTPSGNVEHALAIMSDYMYREETA